MAVIDVRVEVTGLKELKSHLSALEQVKVKNQLAKSLGRQLDHGVAQSQLRAPILTGALRASIRRTGVRQSGSTVTGDIQAGGPGVPYAFRWHEEPFNLGPVSTLLNAGGLIGNKYISRAVDAFRFQWQAEIERDLAATIRTGQVV